MCATVRTRAWGRSRTTGARSRSVTGRTRSNLGQLGCHNRQHIIGEQTFWADVKVDPEKLIAALIKASPKRADIEKVMKDRA